jgi:hypothetical protein
MNRTKRQGTADQCTSQPATSGRFFKRSALYFQQNWTTSTGMASPLPPRPFTNCAVHEPNSGVHTMKLQNLEELAQASEIMG